MAAVDKYAHLQLNQTYTDVKDRQNYALTNGDRVCTEDRFILWYMSSSLRLSSLGTVIFAKYN
jgi:hypothetical protein